MGRVRQGHSAISWASRGPLDAEDGVIFYYVLRLHSEGEDQRHPERLLSQTWLV